MKKEKFYKLTNHAYIRAKQRISKKIINNIDTITELILEVTLNDFIRKCTNYDTELGRNNTVLFLIPDTNDMYIVTKNDTIITIKKSSQQNLLNLL